MSGPGGVASTVVDPRWPVVRRPTARSVLLRRAAAVVLLAYAVLMVVFVVHTNDPSPWVWAAVTVGGLLNLAGVTGMWLLAPRSPSWRGPGHAAPSERAQVWKALRAGEAPDDDARRLMAESVAAAARQPLVTALLFATSGTVLIGTPDSAPPLAWLGLAGAVCWLAVLVAMTVAIRQTRDRHRAAERADALPLVAGEGVPFRP